MPEDLILIPATVLLFLAAGLEAAWLLLDHQSRLRRERTDRARELLGLGRQLLALSGKRMAAGDDREAYDLCRRARELLEESRRLVAGLLGEAHCLPIDRDLERCDSTLRTARGLFQEQRDRALRAQQLAARVPLQNEVDGLLAGAERCCADAEAAFISGDFLMARNSYGSMRAKLNEARRIAQVLQSPAYLDLIDREMERAQREIFVCNCWVYDGKASFRTPRTAYVKGVISPYFKREDGSSAPRPG